MRETLHDGRRGIALVIVLSMIVLITILVVSFTSSMRTERQASHSMAENERTKLVAEAALAHAISILSSNIPQPVPPIQPVNGTYPQPIPVNWAVNPGMLSIITGPSGVTQVPLSTNPTTDYVSTSKDANLNLLQASTNQYPIVGTGVPGYPMYVAWAPMLQNPATAASAANPLVARYAFWIDDENAKINVNTAYGKPPAMVYTNTTPGFVTERANPTVGPDDVFPLGHPGSVNLSALNTSVFTVDPSTLLHTLKTYGASKTPEVIKTAVTNGDPEAFYQANKFYLTATSRDPEFNVFGKSRLFMYAGPTGQLDTASGGGMFQRFRDLDAPMYFHGNENRDPAPSSNSVDPTNYPLHNPFQDYTALYYTAKNLSSVLNSRTWPGMPARSFVDKWGGNDAALREADQVAWNVVAMGSFGDLGPYTLATPGLSSIFGNHLPVGTTGSSGSVNYPNAAVPIGAWSKKPIVPAVPRPMVDEICLNILPVPQGQMYRLLFSVAYGVWLPPNYPATDFSQPSCDFFVGATHLEYSVSQNGVVTSSQVDSQYLNNTYNGIKKLQAFYSTPPSPLPLQPGGRMTLAPIANQVDPTLTPEFYARNGNNFNSTPTADVPFSSATVVTVTMRMRLFVRSVSQQYAQKTQAPPSQLIPVWDTHDPVGAASTSWNPSMTVANPNSLFLPPADDPKDYVEFKFDLDLSQPPPGSQPFTRSLYIADPRTGGLARMWKPSWVDASGKALPPNTVITDTLGQPHNGAMTAAISSGMQLSKFGYVDMTPPSTGSTTVNALPHPSIGIFSLVPTGMQRGVNASNLKLQPNATPAELPDWLLLDLFAPTVSPPSTSTAWPDIVKMNATAGKININAAIFPNTGSFTPPSRLLPLQALLTNTPPGPTVAQNIVNHVTSSGNNYAGGGTFYNYPGEICEIKGIADTGATDFDKEATVRNLASAITTKSNTFTVWGVAQTVKKLSTNHQYGQYENGDLITGEKRFQAIVERFVWPGADGTAGNARVDSNGKYDQLTQGATQPGAGPAIGPSTWEGIDGPDAPTYPINSTDPANATSNVLYNPYDAKAASGYNSGSLESANNPVGATMKYRVIYFKYLE